jgi:hypothetical protein
MQLEIMEVNDLLGGGGQNSSHYVDGDNVTTRKSLFHSMYATNKEEGIKHSAKIAFLDNLPLKYVRFFPFRISLILGILSYTIMIGTFVYFFTSGYIQSTKEQFISLDKSSGLCTSVQRALTSTYSASNNAIWEGVNGFYFSNAIYEVEFLGYASDKDGFYDDMMNFYNQYIVPMGEKAVNQMLTVNLLNMMSFAGIIVSDLDDVIHNNVFSFTATPAATFNQQYATGTMCNSDACCYVYPDIDFDTQTIDLKMTYDYATFTADSFCTSVDTLEQLGYDEDYDHDSFRLDIDMAAFVIALSLNMELLQVPGILDVIEGAFPVNAPGYTSMGLVDPRYPGMAPVNCLVPNEGTPGSPICFMSISDSAAPSGDSDPVYALPVFNHYLYEFCTCEGPYSDLDEYNTFDLMSGLIYFKMDNFENGYYHLYSMALHYATTSNFGQMNNDAYYALLYSSGYGSNVTLADSFEFCEYYNTSCNMIAVNSYSYRDHYVSSNYYQVNDGNCNDIMTIPAFEDLASSPPTSLTEQYYKCFALPQNAFFDAAGIAFGNMSAFAPLLLLVLIPLATSLVFWCIGEQESPKLYTEGEKDAAAKELALHLLRIKDMKHEDLDKDSVLYRLGNDLKILSEQYNSKADTITLKRRWTMTTEEALPPKSTINF